MPYLIPLIGMALFVVCYVVAAGLYPGGSWNDPGQVGFSWRHNYLCDLLDTRAVNGMLNTGRYWARVSLAFLCLGLIVLWYHLPILTKGPAWFRHLLRYSGMAALGAMVFLRADNHDLTVRIAGLFGLVALSFLLLGLWKKGHKLFVLLGAWCLGMFLVNYTIYETGDFVYWLPLIQKITFLSFMAWFVWMAMFLRRNKSGSRDPVHGDNPLENQLNP
jgi:hypothetical protein